MKAAAAIAVTALSAVAHLPGATAEPAPRDPEAVDAEVPGQLTTPLWRPPPRFDLHWRLLGLPEVLVELAAAPVAVLVSVTERYRLDKRVIDLLTSDDERIKLRPKVKLSFGDGLGLGASLALSELFSKRRAQMEFAGTLRLDGDYKFDYLYSRTQPQIEGRQLTLYMVTERDGNAPYFGVGGDSAIEDRRVLRIDESAAIFGIDLHRQGAEDFIGIAELGARRRSLRAGSDTGRIPVGEPGDTVEPPPGFGVTANYAEATVGGRLDSRDVEGRPTRGQLTEVRLTGGVEITGRDLSGLRLEAQTVYYIPVMPLARVLVLTGGAAGSIAPLDDHEIPLHLLTELGRKRFLRGYERERFVDRYALWANAEYRFPIYEYLATRVGLDAFLFVDGATVFGEDDLGLDTLRYSYGLGMRAAHDTEVIGGLTLGFSPEGFEINLGLGREL